jgi:hypothetical protein
MLAPIDLARLLRRKCPQMTYLVEAVACPFCEAEPGATCVTKGGRRSDYPHSDRTLAFDAEVTR